MAETLSPEQKIIKSRVQLLRTCGFFGTLALRLIIKEKNDNVDTCATNGRYYYYNKDFVNKLNQGQMVFVTLHEVLHCALSHILRRGNRIHHLWNVACDQVINLMIKDMMDNKLFANVPIDLPKGVLLDNEFKGMSSEQVYAILLKEAEKNSISIEELEQLMNGTASQETKDKVKNGSKYGTIIVNGTIDQHTNPEKDEKSGEAISEADTGKWKDYLSAAKFSDSQKMIGKLPGNLRRYIEDILYPKQNWKNVLKSYLVNEKKDYSFDRPDERLYSFDYIFPSYIDDEASALKKAYIAYDMSGSISKEELSNFAGDTKGILEEFEVTGEFISWDTRIHDVYSLEGFEIETAEIHGGGGSNCTCVFNYIEEKGEEYSVIIIFTDGHIDFPKDKKYERVIWVVTSDNSILERELPFGMLLHYEE